MGLFDLQPTVTLYDLTNTYFGEAGAQPQAKRGHSREAQRLSAADPGPDARRQRLRAPSQSPVREHRTLAGMLEALDAPAGALVVMDRGVATEAAIGWLRDNRYRGRRRERHRSTPRPPWRSARSRVICTRSSRPTPARSACTVLRRAGPQGAIVERAAARFEAALTTLNEGLARPRAHKRLGQVWQRIGRLRAKHPPSTTRSRTPPTRPARRPPPSLDPSPPGRLDGHPSGRLCCAAARPTRRRLVAHLPTLSKPSSAHEVRTRPRPIYHHKPQRADGHLFITVIAYQLVQVIRTRLRAHGEHASWTTLRRILEGQQRVTATFRRPDGRTLHAHRQAEPEQRAIYDALGVDPQPGGVRKTTICRPISRGVPRAFVA